MHRRFYAACLAAAAMTASAGATSASAATTTYSVPFSAGVVNDCTGELVTIQGTTHVKATDNTSLAGIKYQIQTHFAGAQGTAAGTGARYVMTDQTSDMSHAAFDAFGNAQQTMENTTNLTRQREDGGLVSGDDLRLHVLMHLTISNGITRAEKWDIRADCR